MQLGALGGPAPLEHDGQPVDDDVEETAHQQPKQAGKQQSDPAGEEFQWHVWCGVVAVREV